MKIKGKINKNYVLMFALVGILGVMIFTSQTFQTVLAYSITTYSNNGASPTNVAVIGNIMLISGSNTVKTYNINNPSVLLGSATCTGCDSVAVYNGFFYSSGNNIINKIALTQQNSPVIVATLSTTSTCSWSGNPVTTAGILVCATQTATPAYKTIDLNTFTVTFTSANIGTGVTPCNGPMPSYIVNGANYVFIYCTNSNRVSTFTLGNSTAIKTVAINTLGQGLCVSEDYGSILKVFVPYTNGASTMFNYTSSGGFTALTPSTTLARGIVCSYDQEGRRFIIPNTSTNNFLGYDANNGNTLWGVSASTTFTSTRIYVVNNGLAIAPNGSGNNFMFFDMTGLVAGNGGTAGGGTPNSAGINCDLPENTNILICRLTSQTGGNIGGLGGIIDTGITNVLVNAGVISGSDTNPKTNGVGYLIVAVGLGIFISMMFLASKGQLREIPTFVWAIGTIAIVGSITAIGWIDPTFLVISIIGIVALAVAKTRESLFAGGFGGGTFNGE